MDISVSALFLYRLLKTFRTPITASECEKFDKSWVSDASRRKWAWVLKVFEEWKKQRNEAVLKQDYSGEPVIQVLNANGTVDNVVSYQFLCILYIKFPKTGCNIFNNCSLHTAILKILQPAHCNIFNIAACLFSAFNYITPENFPANKKDRPRFPQTVVLHLLRLQSVI